MESVTKLIHDVHIVAETKDRSDRELNKLDDDKLTAFITEQAKLLRVSEYVGCTAQVNIGKALLIMKGRMPHGDFRPWAEKTFKLAPATITQCMKMANEARIHHVNPATLSGRALLKLNPKPKLDKNEARKLKEKHDKREPEQRRKAEYSRIADRVEQALHDDKAVFGEVLVPRLKAVLKEYGKTAERQSRVREE